MKRMLGQVIVGIIVLVLVFSPYLLIIDFERSAPFVLMVWLLSITYFLFLKRRIDRILELKNNPDNEPENQVENTDDDNNENKDENKDENQEKKGAEKRPQNTEESK